MRRRAYLKGIAASQPPFLAGLSGCVTDSFGIETHSRQCPSVWTVIHGQYVSADSSPVGIRVTPEAPSTPRAELTARVTNNAAEPWMSHTDTWFLFKRFGGQWRVVAPHGGPAGRGEFTLTPGESRAFSFAVDNTRLDSSGGAHDSQRRLRLGAGEYLFELAGYGRRFSLSGEPLSAVATADTRVVEETQNTVVLSVTPLQTPHGDARRRATLVVERAEVALASVDCERRYLVEDLYNTDPSRFVPLRSAISVLEGRVDTVRLTTDVSRFPAFGVLDEELVAVDDIPYRLSTEDPDAPY